LSRSVVEGAAALIAAVRLQHPGLGVNWGQTTILKLKSVCSEATLPVVTDRFWPILLKKSVCPNCLIMTGENALFCTLLREIRVRMPLPKVKISISDAYFSDAQTMADFFNRIGRFLPVATGRNRSVAIHRDRQKTDRRSHPSKRTTDLRAMMA